MSNRVYIVKCNRICRSKLKCERAYPQYKYDFVNSFHNFEFDLFYFTFKR